MVPWRDALGYGVHYVRSGDERAVAMKCAFCLTEAKEYLDLFDGKGVHIECARQWIRLAIADSELHHECHRSGCEKAKKHFSGNGPRAKIDRLGERGR